MPRMTEEEKELTKGWKIPEFMAAEGFTQEEFDAADFNTRTILKAMEAERQGDEESAARYNKMIKGSAESLDFVKSSLGIEHVKEHYNVENAVKKYGPEWLEK